MSISEQEWVKIQEFSKNIEQYVNNKEKQAKFQEEKEVDSKGVKYTQKLGTVGNVGCIYGKANIKCSDLEKIATLEQQVSVIDSKTPKEQRHGLALRQLFKCPNEEGLTVTHQVNESPVMLISSRSFVFVRKMIKTENSVAFYVESYDCENIKDDKKVVRGEIFQYQKYTKIDDKNVLGESFFYVDPKGSIPLKLFNTQLEGQMGQLKYIKKTVESEHVE